MKINSRTIINDACTNFVYISDKLKEFYPGTYGRLTRLFDEMDIEWDVIKGTKDIWIRDYMPIQISDEHFLVYKYDPDYLKETGTKFLTDSKTIFKTVLHHSPCKDIRIKLDGGNFVVCGDHVVLTDKVFRENGQFLYDSDFCNYLKAVLSPNLILLPWRCLYPQDPYADIYGHADGFVQWTGEHKVLMSNHRESQPEEADEIRSRLEDAGFEVTEMLFDVPNPSKDFNWA